MKRKSKTQNTKKKSEFRYHDIELINLNNKRKKIKHPTYIFLEKGNTYIYVSITHSNNIKGTLVIKLRKNPNPKDGRESYRIVGTRIDTKDKFGKRRQDWKIDPQDEEDIRKEYKKR